MTRRVALDRANVIAWVTWCGYTLGCAWPMWTVAPWVYGAAWLGLIPAFFFWRASLRLNRELKSG